MRTTLCTALLLYDQLRTTHDSNRPILNYSKNNNYSNTHENMILNFDLLDEFHSNETHLPRFLNLLFLQKSSVSSFAGLTKNSKFYICHLLGWFDRFMHFSLNFDLLNKFHGIFRTNLCSFENFIFLQNGSVSSFAGFTENSKSLYLPFIKLIW